MANVTGRRKGFTAGSIRGRSVLAGIALLIVFGTMATLAIWRANNDRHDHAALEHKSRAVAYLQETRAQFYLSGTLLAAAALSEEPLPFIESYRGAVQAGQTSLQQAEAEFAAENDPEALSALQRVGEQFEELWPGVDDMVAVALNSDMETARNLAVQYLPELWPSASLILDDIGELAQIEQAKLATAAADANREANTSHWLFVAFGTAGFLVILAVLANLIRSVVPPLASLQRSVRAVTSGDMESRAEVCGPEEVASLAADFNEMISQLKDSAKLMQHRLDVESAVGRTSALLDTAEDVDWGLNSALQILAEAVDAEHAYIFMFRDENTKMDNTHEWNAAGIIAAKDRFANLDCATYSWWVDKLLHNDEVILYDLSQLPPEAAAERALLEKMRARCALAVPFGPSGKPAGFIGFGDKRHSHVWRDEDVRLIRLASETISSFINRRNAEQALRESEERFRSLSNSAPVGIFLTDSTGASIYVNEWLLSISGLSLEQALGLGWFNVIHPGDRDGVIEEKERSNVANDEFAKDFRIVTPQGDVRWVSVRSKPVGNAGQRVGTLEDITERRQAEDALRQSEERFRTLGASAPIGIFQTDATGNTVFSNDRLKEMLDQSFGLEYPWQDAIHPDDRKEIVKELTRSLERSVEFAKEFRVLTPKGVVHWARVHARDLRSENGELTGVVGTIEDVTDRRQAEDALRQSEERFRSLGASAPIGIFQTDVDGEAVFTNDRLDEIAGVRFGPGYHWYDAVHPDERDGVIREVFKSIADRTEFVKEMRFLTPQGVTHWIHVHAKELRSKDGRFAGLVGTVEDITERKQADDALRQSEERFRTLGASAPIGIFHSDAEGKVAFVNERFVEIAGEPFAEPGRNWYDVIHPLDRDYVIKEVIEAIRTRGEFAREFRLLTPQGTTRWVSARARDMRDKNDGFIGLMGTIQDITERREKEEALRQSEERFRSLSASAPVGILLTDTEDTVTYSNECLRAIIGIGAEERLDNLSRDEALAFVHPDDLAGIVKADIEASNLDEYEFLREFRIITRERETRWVRVHVIPILSGEGKQTGRVGTVEDITEHKMLEEERQSAYERTTLLLAMAAEARDPYTEHHLYRIRGYSEAIALRMGLSPEMAKEIGLASLLHDLGKTRVPDAILTKPGPLTEQEWQVMRRHTVWGEELLPASAWFATARQIARSHHENWDGTGYPDGLKADGIPLAAAIVAVADGFDAMTSKRPYKAAWPSARAIRELKTDGGHRYSPQVVEAFEQAVAEGVIARIAGARNGRLSDLMKAAA